MRNNFEVCILFNDSTNIVLYCSCITFNQKGFTIQFLDSDSNMDEMFISIVNISCFEVYPL